MFSDAASACCAILKAADHCASDPKRAARCIRVRKPRSGRKHPARSYLALQRRPSTTYRGRASEVRRANPGRAPEQRPRDRGVRRCQLTGGVIADLAQRLQRIVIAFRVSLFDKESRRAVGVGRAEIGSLEDRAACACRVRKHRTGDPPRSSAAVCWVPSPCKARHSR